MDLTSCYSELKASLEALSKENITDLSYLHDRVMVKLQLFMYTNRIEQDEHSKLKITLSSEVENLGGNDTIANENGVSAMTVSGLAFIFILISLIELGVSAIVVYMLFFGGLGFLLCLIDLSSTEQRNDKRKKVIFKMCVDILDKEKEKLDITQ
ncbi:hypothetical protein LY28_00265 [Ruminiclostridium sufflavum DSM 19573]|uniref:Uncharacterized protein n=1 Tax=Ruminiclostridium sufflavum DSM 19573 TaxID=1121337 RepID=A0A318YCP4_9FIRM|nr:hypothetical protein [Ruminiclostridium sufflavum]PYG90382.1 hypothetical protein LY28_00265 [Ruminiclostridium sufflavum DSM 19573]